MPETGTIMVVEDDAAVRELIAEVLREAGHQAVEYADAREALLSLETVRPVAITLDLAMPSMDGFQFITLLRQHPHLARTPVIALTAATEDLRHRLSREVDASLKKPFDLDDLVEAVERAIAQRGNTP